MFNSGNSTPFTMPVQPAYSGVGNGMNGWGGDFLWIIVVFALLFGWGNNGWGGNCCWIILLVIIIFCCCGSWGNGNNCGCGCGCGCHQ